MPVDELEIEGFKPLKSLKFDEDDLGMVNVITGRNNTGKSSILEGIDLLYNPGHLESFSEHAGDLINKDIEMCSISDGSRNLAIRPVKKENTPEYFTRILIHFLSNVDVSREDERETGAMGGLDEMDFIERLGQFEKLSENDIIRMSEVIEQGIGVDMLPLIGEEILIVEIDGGLYPYVHLSETSFRDVLDSINSAVKERIAEEADIPEDEINITHPYPIRREFFLDDPVNVEKAKLIKTPIKDVNDYKPDRENDAIKIDDIEDYIRERGLVDNLKDFDLDNLVFEEDSEKYWIPYDFMGDGFKSMVGILWELVEDDESEIVMIEEPENHMHPGYVREMFDFLVTMSREDDVQLFITTHSIDFINYMFDENLPDEHRELLEDELSVIRMHSAERARIFDYEEAKKNSEELHLDLRGI